MTRCKFTCISVTKRRAWSGCKEPYHYDAEFSAVTSSAPGQDREDSEPFWAATPSGDLKLSTILSDVFEPGRDYYLDLTPTGPA